MAEEKKYLNLDLYSTVRGIAVKVLNRVDRTDAYLDKLLENELKNSELSGQDKALLYELVHGVTRWSGRIDWILNGFFKGQFSKCVPNVKNAMRVALYQILFLDKIPDYAAVNEAVEFIKKLQGQKPADLTNAVLRNIIRNKNAIRYPDPDEDPVNYMSAFYSHPSWMVKRWLLLYGRENTEALLTANNERPSLTLRINTLKISIEEFKKLLDSVQLKFSPGKYFPDYIRLKNLSNIADWEYFEKGYFSIQDESTAFSVRLLDPQPGMRVLDLCAAPGGKTSYISNLMNNTGEIVALDRYESRLKIFNKNLNRLGITNVTTFIGDAEDYQGELFDRVLADVPCSGFGTLSKKPDIKWKKDLGDIRKLSSVQYDLLCKASKMVKPGGVVVYSTCTIEPEENLEVVNKFLSSQPEFQIESAASRFSEEVIDCNGCIQTLPHIHMMDGAFAVRLVRKP